MQDQESPAEVVVAVGKRVGLIQQTGVRNSPSTYLENTTRWRRLGQTGEVDGKAESCITKEEMAAEGYQHNQVYWVGSTQDKRSGCDQRGWWFIQTPTCTQSTTEHLFVRIFRSRSNICCSALEFLSVPRETEEGHLRIAVSPKKKTDTCAPHHNLISEELATDVVVHTEVRTLLTRD